MIKDHKNGMVRVTWPHFKIWDTSVSLEETKLYFQILYTNWQRIILHLDQKFTWMGHGLGHMTTFKILGPTVYFYAPAP